MQFPALIIETRAQPPTTRRSVVVEDDTSFLSRHLVAIADMIAWRCGLSSGFDLVVVGRGGALHGPWEPRSVAARVAGDAGCSVLVVN